MQKSINRWKVAFFFLLFIVIMTIMFIFGSIFFYSNEYVNDESVDLYEEQIDSTYFTIHTTKAQLNDYLAKKLDGNYSIKLFDDYGTLYTTLSIFSMEIPTEISFLPTLLSDGNLQFMVTSIKIGGLSLPEEVVLQYVKEAVQFPDWISVDARSKRFHVHVNDWEVVKDLYLYIEKFNLKEDEIIVNLVSK